jgi:hypothetical protein
VSSAALVRTKNQFSYQTTKRAGLFSFDREAGPLLQFS